MSLSVADIWFGVEPAGQDLLRLREAHIDPYLSGNMWLLRGRERALLIDSGTGIVPLRPTVEAVAGLPVAAVALNCFYDHAGGLHEFEERLGFRGDAEALAAPTTATSLSDRYVSDDMLRALPRADYTTAGYALAPAPLTRRLNDGDVVDLGGRRLEVLHTPGVSAGSLSLWEADSGRLFTSDLLFLFPDGRIPTPRDPAAFARSLARIAALPVEMVHPGHFGAFDGDRMRAAIDRYNA